MNIGTNGMKKRKQCKNFSLHNKYINLVFLSEVDIVPLKNIEMFSFDKTVPTISEELYYLQTVKEKKAQIARKCKKNTKKLDSSFFQ